VNVGRLLADAGDFLARHETTKPLKWFREKYWNDPVGFAWDVLGIRLWSKQRETLELLRDNRFTSVLAANGSEPAYRSRSPWSSRAT
jgi:hypothetical protein